MPLTGRGLPASAPYYLLRNLGILARERGQPVLAHQLYEEALAASRQVGDQRESARTLNNLGVLARQ